MPPPNHQTGAAFSGVAMKNARSCAWSVRTDCADESPATAHRFPGGTLEFRRAVAEGGMQVPSTRKFTPPRSMTRPPFD